MIMPDYHVDPDVDKMEGKRRTGGQRMKWLNSVIGTEGPSLGRLWEKVGVLVCYGPWQG